MAEKELPKPPDEDERGLEYLICRECNTPCYTFEMDKGKVSEAICLICGNEDILLFNLREEEPDE